MLTDVISIESISPGGDSFPAAASLGICAEICEPGFAYSEFCGGHFGRKISVRLSLLKKLWRVENQVSKKKQQ
jgi:hypothetical protein